MATILDLCRQSRWRRLAFVLGATVKLLPYVATPVHAQQTQRVNVSQIGGQTATPMPYICDNSTGILSTVINIVSTQTQIVAGSTKSIYVCGYSLTTQPGTTTTFKFVEGTSTDCITGQADKSGTYQASSNYWGMVENGGGTVLFKTSSGASLCIDTTSSGIYGRLTYISST
jgi:hypothetical protein